VEGERRFQSPDAAAAVIHRNCAGIFSDHCIRPWRWHTTGQWQVQAKD